MGVFGLAALLQLVVLEATDTPTKAHFGVFVVVSWCRGVVGKGEYKVDRVGKIGFMAAK